MPNKVTIKEYEERHNQPGLKQRIEKLQGTYINTLVKTRDVLTELDKTIAEIKKLKYGQKDKKTIGQVIGYDDALTDVLKALDSERIASGNRLSLSLRRLPHTSSSEDVSHSSQDSKEENK